MIRNPLEAFMTCLLDGLLCALWWFRFPREYLEYPNKLDYALLSPGYISKLIYAQTGLDYEGDVKEWYKDLAHIPDKADRNLFCTLLLVLVAGSPNKNNDEILQKAFDNDVDEKIKKITPKDGPLTEELKEEIKTIKAYKRFKMGTIPAVFNPVGTRFALKKGVITKEVDIPIPSGINPKWDKVGAKK